MLIALHIYSLRHAFLWAKMPEVLIAASVVPIMEELLFRGFILGVLLRSFSRLDALLITSALFSIIHFLKAPERSSPNESVNWLSGFVSIAHSFWQFGDPLLLAAGFLTSSRSAGSWPTRACKRARSGCRSGCMPAGFLPTALFGRAAHRKALGSALARERLAGWNRASYPRPRQLGAGALLASTCRRSRYVNPFRGLVSLFIRVLRRLLRADRAGENLCAGLRGKSAAHLAALLRQMLAAIHGAITGAFYLCELRRARLAFRCRGLGLSKPRCGAKSDPRFQIRPANASAPSCWPLAGRNAGRCAAAPASDSISSCRCHYIRRGNVNADSTRRSCSRLDICSAPSWHFLSAGACSALATPPRKRNSIAASEWKICVARFVYGRGCNVQGLRMLLVDDVLTTGSTLSECASVLKKAGALSVHAATAARG